MNKGFCNIVCRKFFSPNLSENQNNPKSPPPPIFLRLWQALSGSTVHKLPSTILSTRSRNTSEVHKRCPTPHPAVDPRKTHQTAEFLSPPPPGPPRPPGPLHHPPRAPPTLRLLFGDSGHSAPTRSVKIPGDLPDFPQAASPRSCTKLHEVARSCTKLHLKSPIANR